MATNYFNAANEAVSINGLGTFPFIITETKFYNIEGKITLPNITGGAAANSSIVVTVNLNGAGAFYTGAAGVRGFKTGTAATAGDTINVILTSAAAQDNQPNSVKTTVSFY